MTDTANLGLPCIEGSQAQKHVTHNDALRILDTLVQLAVLDRDLTTPPSSPAEGQRWIVKTGATGIWAGHVNAIAAWQDGGWIFSAPRTGWVAFVADEGTLLLWNGTAWGDFFSTVTSIQNLALLGIGTTADSSNVLAAKLNNALFAAKTVAEGGDGNLRYKLSKESAAKTLSFLLQDNYSGRAEIGLTGDDDFHFKVSSDGSTWYEGIKIAAATGKITFPISGGPRELLSANRTYYVRTDGSDANSGLGDNAGGAFLTIQKAVDTVATLDINGWTVTIQVRDGTYTGAVTLKNAVGFAAAGSLIIRGNNATPSNVFVNVTANSAFTADGLNVAWDVYDLKLATTTSGHALFAIRGGYIRFNNLEFGACAGAHILAGDDSKITALGNYKISGGATQHIRGSGGAVARCQLVTITLTGTPAFSGAFAQADFNGSVAGNASTFSGSATGPRYSALKNGVVDTNGGGAAYFPGDTAGTTATGGQYV
jgi:Protein of unknown function (DUF2793)